MGFQLFAINLRGCFIEGEVSEIFCPCESLDGIQRLDKLGFEAVAASLAAGQEMGDEDLRHQEVELGTIKPVLRKESHPRVKRARGNQSAEGVLSIPTSSGE